MSRNWRVPRLVPVLLLLGGLAWLAPTSSSGGVRFDCGPAITAAFKITRPANPDRFIPANPGGDSGTTASQSCQMRSAVPVLVGGVALLVGTVGLTAAWSDRRKRPISRPTNAPAEAVD